MGWLKQAHERSTMLRPSRQARVYIRPLEFQISTDRFKTKRSVITVCSVFLQSFSLSLPLNLSQSLYRSAQVG